MVAEVTLEQAKRLFEKLDQNGTGFISFSEIACWTIRHNLHLKAQGGTVFRRKRRAWIRSRGACQPGLSA